MGRGEPRCSTVTARSTSPSSSWVRAWWPSASWTTRRRPGVVSRRRASDGATRRLIAVAKAAMRSSPLVPSAYRRIASSARSTSVRIVSAWVSSRRPAEVIATRRPRRSSSSWPTSDSRAASCWETADGVRCRTSAAAVTVPWSARARSTRNLRTSITAISFAHGLGRAPDPADQRAQRTAGWDVRQDGSVGPTGAGLAVDLLDHGHGEDVHGGSFRLFDGRFARVHTSNESSGPTSCA